ncbi:MAG: TonB-dependent receptor plug domain-containing protein [Armatimonadota bacterium]
MANLILGGMLAAFTMSCPRKEALPTTSFTTLSRLLGCLIALLPSAAFSASSTASSPEQPDVKEEAPIVVTATRVAQAKATVSSSVTVITKKEIQDSGARNLGELLSRRAEVDIRSYGPLGALNTPSVRGSTTEQVLVLLDGVPLNPPQGGGVDLTDLALDGVARIEVLHGAASAHYGSAAVGGVINVITDQPTRQPVARLEQQLGSFGTRTLRAFRSGTVNALTYALAVGHTRSDGDFGYTHPSGRAARRVNADYEQYGLRARIQPLTTAARHFAVSLDWTTSNKGVPGLVYAPSPRARQEGDRTLLILSYRDRPSAPSGLSGTLYIQHQRRRFSNPDSFPAPQYSLQRTHSLGLTLSGFHRHHNGILTYGVEARRDRLTSTAVGRRPYDVIGVFIQEQLRSGRITVIPAGRWDSTRRIASQLSPHIGLLYRLSDGVSVKTNFGRSFRTPSLNDLYWPEDPFSLGNPSLKPERGTDLDFSVASEGRGRLSGSVTFYRSMVSNLIVWQPGILRPGKWSPANVGRAVSTGMELAARYSLRRWSLAGSATVINARDRTLGAPTYGKRLIGRPTALALLRIGYTSPPWSAELAVHRTGRRYESPDNAVSLPPYTTADLRIGWTRGRSELAVHVRNLTNRRYEVVPGYPVPGRSVYLTLTENM